MQRDVNERVVLAEPEKMSILGLLMHGLLSNNLADEHKYARACSMSGDILVKAADMSVTLRFADGQLTIIRGDTGQSKARVAGTMTSLLGVVTGAGMVAPFMAGKLKIGGNPFALLKMLPLITT